VGRSEVAEDVALVRAVRERFGDELAIRCDANRAWSLAEALKFADGVKDCGLEFLEEPVGSLDDLKAFCDLSPVQVAIDESLSDAVKGATMDSVSGEVTGILKLFEGSVGAVVLKPSVLGSVEIFRAIVDVCTDLGVKPIVSATFESSVGLHSLSQLACYTNAVYGARVGAVEAVLHGLGTIDWNTHEPSESRVYLNHACFGSHENGNSLAIDTLNHTVELEGDSALSSLRGQNMLYDSAHSSFEGVGTIHEAFMALHRFHPKPRSSSPSPQVEGAALSSGNHPAVFIHGFLGDVTDWTPLVSSVSGDGRDCYAVGLPGHASNTFLSGESPASSSSSSTNTFQNKFAFTSNSMDALLQESGVSKPVLVAYSMGARLALDMALSRPEHYAGLVIVSSGPGIRDKVERERRALKDMLLSAQIREGGVDAFLESWYEQPLFHTFRSAPQFEFLVAERAARHSKRGLAEALSGLSPGLQEPL